MLPVLSWQDEHGRLHVWSGRRCDQVTNGHPPPPAHMQAFVHGMRRWVRSLMHLADLIIVCISLALEVIATTLSKDTRSTEIGSLLIILRLWRVVRVMHAVGDVEQHVKHDELSLLRKKLARLKAIEDAHHTVIKELHREYTERVR
jgi:hypothetical protein